jgi:transcriptional regulator with XRE-family HTH domain
MLSSGHPAAKLGWTQQTVSKIESGQKRVTVVELVELSRALDFDPAALVPRIAKLAD